MASYADELRERNPPFTSSADHAGLLEYARLVAAMLADEHADAMFEPAARVDDELSWGLGFGLSGDVFWHWGDSGDFQSTVAGSRRHGRALVCLTNSEHGLPLCAELTRRVLGESDARPIQAWTNPSTTSAIRSNVVVPSSRSV